MLVERGTSCTGNHTLNQRSRTSSSHVMESQVSLLWRQKTTDAQKQRHHSKKSMHDADVTVHRYEWVRVDVQHMLAWKWWMIQASHDIQNKCGNSRHTFDMKPMSSCCWDKNIFFIQFRMQNHMGALCVMYNLKISHSFNVTLHKQQTSIPISHSIHKTKTELLCINRHMTQSNQTWWHRWDLDLETAGRLHC